ncbi:MAG: hypothetical protein IT200_07320 [Thermoleophilia bacterium]|nr:hypothetical protein [Thermoleophilia bacterium]
MHQHVATTLRRAALTGAALTATVAGHLAVTPNTAPVAAAPLLWMAMTLVVVPFGAAGVRRAPFAAWGPVRTLASLAALQAVLHVALHAAPWMFGLVEHHHGPLVTPAALVVHVALALALTVPLCMGQRMLARLAAAVRALLPAARRRTLPRPARRMPLPADVPAQRPAVTVRPSRGPPAARLRPAAAPTA